MVVLDTKAEMEIIMQGIMTPTHTSGIFTEKKCRSLESIISSDNCLTKDCIRDEQLISVLICSSPLQLCWYYFSNTRFSIYCWSTSRFKHRTKTWWWWRCYWCKRWSTVWLRYCPNWWYAVVWYTPRSSVHCLWEWVVSNKRCWWFNYCY